MVLYIIKSIACLAIFFLFYKVFLEKENMHVFKRFYLLGALMLAMIIPALVFTEYVEAPATTTTYTEVPSITANHEVIGVSPALEADVLDIEPILWAIYFLGLLFFGLKFIRNLFQIFGRIRRNPKQKLSRFTQVLLQEKIAPHTFFSYIFLNKKKLESNEIPKEVLLHEETHAQQKHSYDVVVVELLQAIFWVNPLIYFTKKAIKLNHEFLADQAVLKKDIDKTTYQNTLLSYLSPDSEKKYQPLANSINYSSIKKRFTVMKTHTSKKAVLLRSLLLLPLLAILVYGFSETNVVPVEPERIYDSEIQESNVVGEELENINLLSINYNDSISHLIAEDINVHIDNNGQLLVQEKLVQIENVSEFLSNFNSDLSKKQKAKIVRSFIHIQEGAPRKIIDRIQEILTDYGSATIDIVGMNTTSEMVWIKITNENEIWVKDKLVQLDELASKLFDISSAHGLKDNLKIQIYSEEILHQGFLNKISKEIDKVGPSSIQVFTEKYIMAENEYQDKIDPRKAQVNLKANKMSFEKESATKEQLVNYNTLAKKYNAIPIENRSIPLNDLKILETVFRKMSSSQKSANQPFPECLLKNTQEGASRKLMAENNTLSKKYNTMLSKKHTARSIEIRILKDGNYSVDGIKVNKNQLTTTVNTLHQDITPEIRNDIMNIHVSSSSEISKKEVWYIFNSLNDYGFYRIVTPNQEVVKGKGNKPFKIIDSEYKILQEKESATPKQISEYNALAKKYNTMLSQSKSIQIKMKDVERLEYIYSLMSKKQKADAEPYPDFPEPPPVPKEPKAPKAPKVLKGEVSDIPMPPTPPEPVSPLDHVIEMAKKDAVFYLEEKEITSDKAIEIMKKNKNINIDSSHSNEKRPVVKMSTKPIRIN